MLKHAATLWLEEPTRSYHEALFSQARVLRQSLKERHAVKTAATSPLIPGILQHAVTIVNRLQAKTSSAGDCIRRSVSDTSRFLHSSQGQEEPLKSNDGWERALWSGEKKPKDKRNRKYESRVSAPLNQRTRIKRGIQQRPFRRHDFRNAGREAGSQKGPTDQFRKGVREHGG